MSQRLNQALVADGPQDLAHKSAVWKLSSREEAETVVGYLGVLSRSEVPMPETKEASLLRHKVVNQPTTVAAR